MGCPGFEPGTSRLKAECSTTELATRECVNLNTADKGNTDSVALAINCFFLGLFLFRQKRLGEPHTLAIAWDF